MKNLLIAALFALPVVLFAQSETTTISFPEGSLIKVTLIQDLNGKTASVGQTIDFELSEDVILDEQVVIAKGAKIAGTITEAASSKALGKKGKLAFSIDYLYLADGKVVKLRNQVEKNLKGRGAVVATGAILLNPVVLLVPGKNAKYEKGEVFTAYVDEDVTL